MSVCWFGYPKLGMITLLYVPSSPWKQIVFYFLALDLIFPVYSSLFICHFTMIFCSLWPAILFPPEGGYFFILLSEVFVTWSKPKVIIITFGLQAYLEHTKHCVQGQQVSSDTEIDLHDLFFQNGKMHVCNLPYLAPVLWTCDWRKLWSKPSYSCFKSSSLCPLDIVGIFIELIFLGDGAFYNDHNDIFSWII